MHKVEHIIKNEFIELSMSEAHDVHDVVSDVCDYFTRELGDDTSELYKSIKVVRNLLDIALNEKPYKTLELK